MCEIAAVVNNILKSTDRFTVPVTTAEFAVMKTACNVCSYDSPYIFCPPFALHSLPYSVWGQQTCSEITGKKANVLIMMVVVGVQFALPQVMGWDRSTSSPQQPKMDQKPSKVDPQLLDMEWDK